MSKENLPIALKSNQLAVNKRKNKRIIEGIKRVGKIALSAGVGISGFVVTTISGPAAIAGFGLYMVGTVNAAMDVIYKKTSKNSMFDQRRNVKGEMYISQSIRDLKSFKKMKGFNKHEKAAMMGLDILIGLQSFKQQFEDRGIITEPARDGKNNLYPQVYSTKTHGVNIDTIEALESLGYIQIERKIAKGRSNLFIEKLEFGQYKEAKDALFSRDESKKVQMYDIALRVTDKPIDFEEIYKQYLEIKGTKGKSEKASSIRRIGIIMETLRKRNIDIVKNDIGETIIVYNSEEPFATRMKREKTDTCTEYRKASYIGDTIDQSPVQTQEKTTQKQIQEENKDSKVVEH